MKKYLGPSIRLTLILILLLGGLYFVSIAIIGKIAAGGGGGETVQLRGKVVGYTNVGQQFTDDNYFWSRPSAVDYNAAGSAGSNKATSNAAYLQTVQNRIDTFLVHHPGVTKSQIRAEMVTASGSGLDPNISLASAYLQAPRVAKKRGIEEAKVKFLINQKLEKGILGPDLINVLKLNVALDTLKYYSSASY